MTRVFHKILRKSEDHMRCHGLSMAQFDVLAHVGAAPGITQQELADSLLVTKGNVCQLLDRMERAHLLERQQQGRSNRIYLTTRGQDLYGQVVPSHEELISHQLSTLSTDEQRALLDILRKLDHVIEVPACAR